MNETTAVSAIRGWLHDRHRFRALLFGHKAVEAGAVCIVLMVQGQIVDATMAHLSIASQTGALAAFPVLGLTLTRFARHLGNRWIGSAVLGLCTFAADVLIHESHYPGFYTEAALTAFGAFGLSLAISYTRMGRYIDRLAESFHRG